jgi:hypothetical protein
VVADAGKSRRCSAWEELVSLHALRPDISLNHSRSHSLIFLWGAGIHLPGGIGPRGGRSTRSPRSSVSRGSVGCNCRVSSPSSSESGFGLLIELYATATGACVLLCTFIGTDAGVLVFRTVPAGRQTYLTGRPMVSSTYY